MTVEQQVVATKPHSYSSNVTAPTCTEDGYTTHTCTRCSDSYTDSKTDKLGHTAATAVVENNVDPTCTAKGSYDSVIYCEVCGKRWRMTELGELEALSGETEFSHIPDWYKWERDEVKKEIENAAPILEYTETLRFKVADTWYEDELINEYQFNWN